MKQITESDKLHEQWYQDAKKQTLETLPDFLDKLMNGYNHDYGTICHALSAGAIATAWAMNAHPGGGITGFQAGGVMWEFIKHWVYDHNKVGLCLIDYDNMLYPQYHERFEKIISHSVWAELQKQAAINIERTKYEYDEFLLKRDQYDKDIAAFIKKYPDYNMRPEFYQRIGFGTALQHEAEEEKIKAGFEFAPQVPYCPTTDDMPVYKHWESIVNGKVPFGYRVDN